ncbi:ATP-binding cassette domain-containing protein, partial [Bartonella sp. CL63NXGY]|uniref:ATP-binding cassette domain-containing protein n=1 Tax=Bartonella sp. CL63NXGY TaxID=3243538 RepID=UPI0035CEBDF7
QLTYQGTIQTQLHFAAFPLNITNPEQLAWFSLIQAAPELVQWKVERELTKLNAEDSLLWQPFSTLSGGEQTKLLLAALFAQDNVFPLLDEPTN